MWFLKRTLSERYSKLVKLIKSIDSHIELTEDEENSLRLHLPNYKGNQPMDFHIYLMEPFLFISFITEIEGEKISCLNNFPQDTDQQDMFNVAMSNNLNRIHQVLKEKYKEELDELAEVNHETEDYMLTRRKTDVTVSSGNKNAVDDVLYSEAKEVNLPKAQINQDSYEIIKECARKLLLSLENDRHKESDKNLLLAELTILSAAMVLDTKDERINQYNDFVKHKILDIFFSIKELDDYDNWIVSNTPGMFSNDSYSTETAIPLEEFEKMNGQVKFFRGKINAYPYDDSFWGEFVDKNGNKQIIYVNQGFPLKYNVSELSNSKTIFGIVEEKDSYLHTEDIFYCLKEIRKRHSMLSIYLRERSIFYKETIKEIQSNKNCHKEHLFQLYNAITNEMLNFNVPYLGIGDLSFDDETVVNGVTGEIYEYDANSFANFSLCIEECLSFLHNRFKTIVSNSDLEQQSAEADIIGTGVREDDLNHVWTDEYGVEYDMKKRQLIKVPKNIVKYTVVEGTRIIGNAAFSNCKKLKTVILPDSITEIKHYAFANCQALFSFVIPNQVKVIGNGVFIDCKELTSIRIPTSLTNFEIDSFHGCEKLETIFVPKGEKNRYEELFLGFNSNILEYDSHNENEVGILDLILHGTTDESGVLYDYDELIVLSTTKPLIEYRVKSGTRIIQPEAFKPNIWKRSTTSLKRLYLPDSIELICDAAFANNEGLEYINIPKNAKLPEKGNPFVGCTNLHTIKWESNETIKEGTLLYNKERTVLIACLPWHFISGVVKSWSLLDFAKQHGKMQVGTFVNRDTGEQFKSCIFTDPFDNKNKTYVAFNSKMGELSPREISERKDELHVVQVDSGNYVLCEGKTIIEPSKHIELPYGLKTIASFAFYNDEGLEEITLPATIDFIGKDAFTGCSSLIAIHIPKGTRPKFEVMLEEWRKYLVEDEDELPF